MTDPLRRVEIIGLPIPLHARAQEHSAELMREMYLIAQQLHGDPDQHDSTHHGDHALPARLLALVDELGQRYAGFTTVQDLRLTEAVNAKQESIDLVYELPAPAAEAAQHLADIFEEADEFCLAGQHLLTLATPADLVAYRRWFLGEIIGQLAGVEATPWPAFRPS
jgi:hypothetical protein